MKTLFLTLLLIGLTAAAQLPPIIRRCNVNRDLNACIKSNLEAAKPFITQGIPDFSVPTLDPFVIPSQSSEIPGFKLSVTNVVITGFQDFDVLNVQANSENDEYKIEILFPLTKAIGESKIVGTLFNAHFDSVGTLKSCATNLHFYYFLRLQRYDNGGKLFLRKVQQNVKVGLDGILELEQDILTSEGEETIDIVEKVGGENMKDLFDVIIPILQKRFVEILEIGFDKFLSIYSYDDLFEQN